MTDIAAPPVADAVALVHWPADAETRESLRRAGRPRLLLVGPDSQPPTPVDDLEDWVREPVSDPDLVARVEWLRRRLPNGSPLGPRSVSDRPDLDDDGFLVTDVGTVLLPPVEARLARELLDHFGVVVGRDAMMRSGWPCGTAGRNTLDAQVVRLRRRLAQVGLNLVTVRSRGFMLQRAPRPPAGSFDDDAVVVDVR